MAVTDYARSPQGQPVDLGQVDWDASCNTAATTTARMDITGLTIGSFRVPNGSSITSVTWYAAASSTDTAVALKDEDGVAVTQTVAADEAHAVPSAVAGCKYVLPVTDAAGTLHFHWER